MTVHKDILKFEYSIIYRNVVFIVYFFHITMILKFEFNYCLWLWLHRKGCIINSKVHGETLCKQSTLVVPNVLPNALSLSGQAKLSIICVRSCECIGHFWTLRYFSSFEIKENIMKRNNQFHDIKRNVSKANSLSITYINFQGRTKMAGSKPHPEIYLWIYYYWTVYY